MVINAQQLASDEHSTLDDERSRDEWPTTTSDVMIAYASLACRRRRRRRQLVVSLAARVVLTRDNELENAAHGRRRRATTTSGDERRRRRATAVRTSPQKLGRNVDEKLGRQEMLPPVFARPSSPVAARRQPSPLATAAVFVAVAAIVATVVVRRRRPSRAVASTMRSGRQKVGGETAVVAAFVATHT